MGYVIYVILALAWATWLSPFILRKNTSVVKAQHVKTRARWGIVLQAIAMSLLWQNRFWEREPSRWRLVLAILFLVAACLLSWTAVRALGQQWRLDAGLNADHQLIRSGPYAFVRHPIYTSMLCMLVGTGLIVAHWSLLFAALLILIAGTEIRVRSEDELLASRFGEEFETYRRSVHAYVPWWRF